MESSLSLSQVRHKAHWKARNSPNFTFPKNLGYEMFRGLSLDASVSIPNGFYVGVGKNLW